MGDSARNTNAERPPAPWEQFVVEAFEAACTGEANLTPSFAAASVVLADGPEADPRAGQFPLRIALCMANEVYLVVIGLASAPPLHFIAEVVHTIHMNAVDEPAETPTWTTPGADLKEMLSEPVAGCFACGPDELAERAVAIVLDHWRRYFGDDDLDDGTDRTGPPVPSTDQSKALTSIRWCLPLKQETDHDATARVPRPALPRRRR